MYTSELYARELVKDRLREAENERLARSLTSRRPLQLPQAVRAALSRLPGTRQTVASVADCASNPRRA